MAYISELVSPKTMGVLYKQDVLENPPYLSESYFKGQKIGTNVLKYLQTTSGAPTLAAASTLDAKPTPLNRGGFQDKFFKTQFFRITSVLTEQDLQDINNALQNGDTQYAATLIDKLYDDKTGGLNAMRARRNYLGMQAMVFGKIAMVSNGVRLNIDYGGDSDFYSSVDNKSNSDWSDHKNANPYLDIRNARDQMKRKGILPNQIVMNSTTFRWIQASEKMKATLPTQNINIANGELLEAQVVDFLKNTFKLNVVIYDGVFKDSDIGNNSEQYNQYIPDGKVLLISAPLPDDSFILNGSSNSNTSAQGAANQQLGAMNFAPTPEELGMRNGHFNANELTFFDIGVTFRESYNKILVQTEDITSMNVLPSLEGANNIFRMNVASNVSDNGYPAAHADSTNDSSDNGKNTEAPKA